MYSFHCVLYSHYSHSSLPHYTYWVCVLYMYFPILSPHNYVTYRTMREQYLCCRRAETKYDQSMNLSMKWKSILSHQSWNGDFECVLTDMITPLHKYSSYGVFHLILDFICIKLHSSITSGFFQMVQLYSLRHFLMCF